MPTSEYIALMYLKLQLLSPRACSHCLIYSIAPSVTLLFNQLPACLLFNYKQSSAGDLA